MRSRAGADGLTCSQGAGKKMKVLIGYDGSEGADLGVEGLRRAGLPPQAVEALVVTVAEVWLPPPPGDEVMDDAFPLQIPEGVRG